MSRPSFARPVHGVRAPGGVYCHVCGCDLVRDGDGRWRVLEDNVRTPSGISYVLENRVAMTRLMPELFAGHRIRAVDNYPSLLLDALRAVAPAAESHPTVVLWTPGAMNSAYFEHAFLARQMGVELVEPGDLVVRDAVCYIRTTSGLQRVHTIYRRLDDDFIDPLEFRSDSMLGVPGLVRAYRAGTVAIANAIGTGVADDKAIYYYVPEMIRFYLGEEPILDNVPTYLLSDETQRRHVLGRLSELVIKPTSESRRQGRVHRPCTPLSEAERELQARMIDDEPDRFIAQELVHLSTAARPRSAAAGWPRVTSTCAPVRRVRRGDPDRSRRPGPRVAPARGVDDRQLLPGRRLQGHVGPRRRGRRRRRCARRGHAPAAPAAPARRALRRHLVKPGPAATAMQTRGRMRPAPGGACTLGCPVHAPGGTGLMLGADRPGAVLAGARDLTRAEHTARILDGAFHADVAGGPGERGVALSWEGVLATIGAKSPALGEHEPATAGDAHPPPASLGRAEVARLLTLDTDNPASVVSCVARARERGRTMRDVVSTEKWEALNSFYLLLGRYDLQAALQTGPYSFYQEVKERCALFWGLLDRTLLRDEGRAFLEAGGRIEEADMILRMLRVAIPTGPLEEGHETEALALLHAVGGFQAYRRAVRARADSRAGRSASSLFDSAYPGSVASSVEALVAALPPPPTTSRDPRRPCCGWAG